MRSLSTYISWRAPHKTVFNCIRSSRSFPQSVPKCLTRYRLYYLKFNPRARRTISSAGQADPNAAIPQFRKSTPVRAKEASSQVGSSNGRAVLAFVTRLRKKLGASGGGGVATGAPGAHPRRRALFRGVLSPTRAYSAPQAPATPAIMRSFHPSANESGGCSQARCSGSSFRGRATPTKHHVARIRVARAFAELREPGARAGTGACERIRERIEKRCRILIAGNSGQSYNDSTPVSFPRDPPSTASFDPLCRYPYSFTLSPFFSDSSPSLSFSLLHSDPLLVVFFDAFYANDRLPIVVALCYSDVRDLDVLREAC